MCSLEGKKYFRNIFTNEPEKKVHLRQKKSIKFTFFCESTLLSTLKITLLKENTILRVTGITTEQQQKQRLEERVAL